MMTTQRNAITIMELRRKMATIINRAAYGGERFELTHYGRRLAAILPITDLLKLIRFERKGTIFDVQNPPENMTAQQILAKRLEKELGV